MAQKKHAVYIHWDKRKNFITVYGDKPAIGAVKKEAKTFLQEFSQSKTKFIKIPREKIRAFVEKNGLAFKKLQEKFPDVQNLEFRLRMQEIFIQGKEDEIQAIEMEVESIFKKISSNSQNQNLQECGICFCEIEKDAYRLGTCDHAFHQECFVYQMKSADTVPLCCAQCNQPILLRDIAFIFGDSDDLEINKFYNLGLRRYLETNAETMRNCPTANCIGIFSLSDQENSGKVRCLECEKDHCLNCGIEFHEGLTCAQYKSALGDNSIELFLLNNGGIRCPGCKFVIQKSDGCNAMKCSNCKRGFCYLCGKGSIPSFSFLFFFLPSSSISTFSFS